MLQSLRSPNINARQLPYLEALEENLLGALRLLHSYNISYPVSTDSISFSQPWDEAAVNIESFQLLFRYNQKARWASNKLPPTWQNDELSKARSLFFIPKVVSPKYALSCLYLIDPI